MCFGVEKLYMKNGCFLKMSNKGLVLIILVVVFGCPLPSLARDSAVVFNEVHYHPANDEFQLEYIELYNQLAVDVDLSNWRIDGDIDFDFPEGVDRSSTCWATALALASWIALPMAYASALAAFSFAAT